MVARLLTILLCLSIASCGGGSNSGGRNGQPPQPVTFDLVYPAATSLTSASEIPVVGLANANRVTSVTIKNGGSETSATLDSDGHWRADAVPLVGGSNTLIVALAESNGTVTELTIANVLSSPVLSHPIGTQFDPTRERVLVLDTRQLLSYDVATDELAVLSSPTVGTGPDFGHTLSFVRDSAGAILVSGIRGILKVDPITGDRTEHILLPPGSGPTGTIAIDENLNRLFIAGFFDDLYVADLTEAPPILATTIKPFPPFGITAGGPVDSVYESTTDKIFTVSAFSPSATAIDAANGDRTPVFLNPGGTLTTLVGIDYDSDGSQLIILGASGTVIAMDPVTQASSILHPPSMSSTLPILLRGLSIGAGKFWSVGQLPGELRSIDVVSGDHSVLASSLFGDGAPPGVMLMGRYEATTDRFIAIADWRVVAIDPSTGTRQQLAELLDQTQFPPQNFNLPGGMTLSQNGERLWVADRFDQTVTEVDLLTGASQEISGPNTGAGPLHDQISGIDIDRQDSLIYLTDRFVPRVFSLEVATGQRTLVANLAVELTGAHIRSSILDAASDRLLLNVAPLTPGSSVEPAIYALNLTSMELTMLADLSTVESPFGDGSTPQYLVSQMSLSEDGASLYIPVSGNANIPFARVDIGSGEVVAVGSASTGTPLFLPNVIEVTATNRLLALDGTSALMIVDADTGDRSIVSK